VDRHGGVGGIDIREGIHEESRNRHHLDVCQWGLACVSKTAKAGRISGASFAERELALERLGSPRVVIGESDGSTVPTFLVFIE
jgi:hypothetical protein